GLGEGSAALLVDGESPAGIEVASSSDPIRPEDLAYIIFTSGSTGAPKGVPITHRNALAFIEGEAGIMAVRPRDRVYHGFSIAFDAAVEELWLAFGAGACLVVADEGMASSGSSLPAELTHARVSVLSLVPTLLSMFDAPLPTVRLLITGGEACPEGLVARWAPGRRMLNTYGPTEATVVATWCELKAGKPVTIGRPLPGYRAEVVDEAGRPVAAGEAGELLIGGDAVSPGYLGRPDLNAKKFFVKDGIPWFRTGDRVARNATGELEFHGRIDDQVKIRGFRIELGEVEAALARTAGVSRAAVTRREDEPGMPYLAAYVIATRGKAFDEKAAREAMKRTLPSYMIPATFTVLDSFPVTSGGKVDRRSLPAPDRSLRAATGRPAASPAEAALLDLWGRYFAPQLVEVDDDFFDLGGHSLLATRLVSDLRESGACPGISVVDVYEQRTLAACAKRMEALGFAGSEESRGTTPPRSASRFQRVPFWRHFLCGAGQLLSLYPLLAIASAGTFLGFWVYQQLFEKRQQITVTALVIIALLLALRPLQLAVAVGLKWALIGRFKPGRHPVWGFYFFRFWLVRQALHAFHFSALKSTPLLAFQFRLLGARIGRGVHLQTLDVLAADLLTIGDGAVVGKDANLTGYVVEDGELIIGEVTIGKDAVIGARALVSPGSGVGDGGELGDGALLRPGSRVPPGARWVGSPASPAGMAEDPPWCRGEAPAAGNPLLLRLGYLLGLAVLPLFPLLSTLPGALILRYVEFHYCDFYGQYWDFWKIVAVAPLSVGVFVVCLCLQIAAAKWILIGRQSGGVHALGSARQMRQWLVDSLLHLSQELLFPLYSTLYLPPWFRLMGAKLGARVEVSTAEHVNPDLLRLEEGSFVADAVCLGAAEVRRGRVRLAPVSVGRNSFLGNNAVIPAGTAVGEEALVGVLSLPPEGALAGEAHASWLGMPSFRLPRRQASTAFGEELTYKPPPRLVAARLAIEAVRILLPGTVMVVLGMALLLLGGHLLDEEILDFSQLILAYPIFLGSLGVASMAFTWALKWLVIGRYRPLERPLWSPFVWKSELVTATFEHLSMRALGDLLLGTPFLPWYFRALGSRMGRRVYLDTIYITEFDLVDLADDVSVNNGCDLQTHLFEDRVMKMDRVTLRSRASAGPAAVVLYGATLGEGTVLEGRSLAMKGEALPGGDRWTGSPARRSD
ncbi:MAG: AMP-binding protein, partial [Spirochaetes bacterium]|nr:AMP-binding protein [Spirochaetota bacterium]